LLCCCLLCGAQAQQAPDPQITIRKTVNLVLVDVIVTDPRGTIVSGLRAKDFEILDEGAPQEIAHFSQDEIPLAIALVVDVSRSMGSVLGPMRNALVHALPTLKPEDRVALFSFAERCYLEIGLTDDFVGIARRIGELREEESTNINDAIYSPANYLGKYAPQGRRVIILVSDTVGDAPGVPFAPADRVEQALLQAEVALFGIRPVPALTSAGHNPKSRFVDVGRLAGESGGFMVDVPKPEGIQSAVESLIHTLKTRYTLGFYPSTAGKPDSIRRLKVRLKNSALQAALPGAVLRYRTQYKVPPLDE
jgi:VWFA-related protein